MAKRIFFAVGILLLSFVAGSMTRYMMSESGSSETVQIVTENETAVLENDEYGFRVSYPKHWIATPIVTVPTPEDGGIASYAVSFCTSLPNPCAEVQIQILDSPLDAYVAVRTGSATNFTLVERTVATLDNVIGAKLIIKNVPSGELTEETVVARGGQLYIIRGAVSPENLHEAYILVKEGFVFL